MESFKVFVSSTSLDLLAERKAVAEILRKYELPVTAMENWDALPADATDVSVYGVDRCDVLVGIYAFRYGFIPPDSTTSVTEQEFERARREGKRCLCYFKDEANVPPVTDPNLIESEDSRNLLEAFKHRIETELVRGRFTSPEDLAAKLAVDIARLQAGYLPGYTRQDLLNRWADHGFEMRNKLVQSALSGHTNLLPSPVLSWWTKFITEKPWHEVMQRELSSIAELAKKIPELSGLGKRAYDLADRLIPRDESSSPYTYYTILTELEKAVTEIDIEDTEELIHDLREQVDAAQRPGADSNPDAEEKLFNARNLLRELRGLRASIELPSFRRCFPVIGSLGSGRTHFIASLLGSTPGGSAQDSENANQPWCENYNFILLLLNQSSTKSLEETILDEINQASGLQWRSLEEFDRFLQAGASQRIRCGIAIDDLQRWLQNRDKFTNAVDELTQFIESNTSLYSLYWLFTLQDTSYSQVQLFNRLLRTHSYFQTEALPDVIPRQQQTKENLVSHFSGWLALDDLNRDEEFGLKLINEGLALQGKSLPDPNLLRENKSILRNLVKPFIASVLLDLQSEQKIDLQRIATLSYTRFVEDFWKKRQDEFTTEYNRIRSGDRDDWSEALNVVAETLSKTGEFNPSQKNLEKSVVELARLENYQAPEEMSTAVIAALIKSGLLKRYKTPDPQKPGTEEYKISFEFEPFWELHLANQIRAWKSFTQLDEAAAWAELVNWFGVVESDEIEEGILEFLLLLLDTDAAVDSNKRGLVSFIQRSVIDCPELPEEALWFSGVNASHDSQAMLMKLVGQTNKEFEVPRLLHSIMYFLVESLPEVRKTPARFQILQPHFQDIHRASFSAYFLYASRRLLRQARDNVSVRRSMRYLGGSEVLGITEALASLTVDVLFSKAEEEFGELNDNCLASLVEVIVEYLRESNEEAKKEYDRRAKSDRWERFFYREWVLRYFCSRLVQVKGIAAYQILDGVHWYDPEQVKIKWPISVEMHREANFALGDWYRMHRFREGAEDYVNLIRGLVYNGDFADREIAFYLIRHSEATHGEKGVVVDGEFAPMLEVIFLDPKLDRSVVSRFYDLFRRNLDEFEKLEAIRATKLAESGQRPGKPSRRR